VLDWAETIGQIQSESITTGKKSWGEESLVTGHWSVIPQSLRETFLRQESASHAEALA